MKAIGFWRGPAAALMSVLAVFVLVAGGERDTAVDSRAILSLRQRAEVVNGWLRWRLENILPELMRREGIDMWLVINREYNEDPVYLSLVPEPGMAARRTSILIFFDRGPQKGVERLSGSAFGMDEWYRSTWTDKTKPQFESLAETIRRLDPKRIGIDVSADWAFGDGLTSSLREKLERALGPELGSRLVTAERLCVGWLETRSRQEMSVYRPICGIAHEIIREAFSNRVIIPEITSTEDVVWWIRQRISDLGLETWFQPSVSIHRSDRDRKALAGDPLIIRRGDLLHCDVGIQYLGLCTDMQWQAYVCRTEEREAPAGLREALRRANRVGEILRAEFRTGRTGREITQAAMERAEAEGLRPLIYSHPLGFHGHAAGCPMDARPPEQAPEGIDRQMEYPLNVNTVYAIEFSSTTGIPEWEGQDVRIGFEEDAVFTREGCRYIDGYQHDLLLIK